MLRSLSVAVLLAAAGAGAFAPACAPPGVLRTAAASAVPRHALGPRMFRAPEDAMAEGLVNAASS